MDRRRDWMARNRSRANRRHSRFGKSSSGFRSASALLLRRPPGFALFRRGKQGDGHGLGARRG